MKTTIRALAMAITLLLFGGAFNTTQAANPKVRLGIGSALSYTMVYVTKDKGFFQEEGVDVEFVFIEIAPDAIQSIIGGSTDAGVGATFALVTFVNKGAPVKAVAYYGYGGDRVALAVRKGSGIHSLTDLYGKKLAVQTGTIGAQMWGRLVSMEKLDASKVDVKNLRNLDLPAAMASGSIDALITWEPNPTVLEERGTAEVIKRGGKYLKGYGAVFFGDEFVAKNPDTVRRFMKALSRGAQFARQNPKEAAAIDLKYVRGATLEALQKSIRYMVLDPRITQASIKSLDGDIAYLKSEGRLSGKVTGKDLVNARFSDETSKAFPALFSDLKP